MISKRNQRWPDEWREEGIRRYESGEPLRDIAKSITLKSGRRCPVDTVAGWVGTRNNRTEHWDTKWPKMAVQLRDEGVRRANIPLIIEIESGRKCDPQTVAYWLRRHDIRT